MAFLACSREWAQSSSHQSSTQMPYIILIELYCGHHDSYSISTLSYEHELTLHSSLCVFKFDGHGANSLSHKRDVQAKSSSIPRPCWRYRQKRGTMDFQFSHQLEFQRNFHSLSKKDYFLCIMGHVDSSFGHLCVNNCQNALCAGVIWCGRPRVRDHAACSDHHEVGDWQNCIGHSVSRARVPQH